MRILPVLFVALLLAIATTSCRKERKMLITGSIDPERFPTMRTTNVSTLISDSGITRYRITSPLWLVFEEAIRPQWKFPQGLHLEKFDDFFRRDATVDCDSATYFKNEQLWRLDGYVNISNMQGEKFLTPQLFWDQRNHTIYSDSFIHIEKSDRVIEGYGFESNERMTNYKVRNVSGIFPVEDFKGGEQEQDTTAGAPVAPTPTTTIVSGSSSPARRSLVTDSVRTAQRSRMDAADGPPLPAQPSQPALPVRQDALKRTPSVHKR